MNQPRYALDGRVAIVTGGNQGIGKGISLALAEAGASVVIACRHTDLGEQVAQQIEKTGRKTAVVSTDVTKSDQVVRLVEKTIDTFGTIDILVNNAGGATGETFGSGKILDMGEKDWDETMAVNFKSVFLCSREVARVMMERRKGSIINMASIFGERPFPNMAAYSAAKAGVINFTRASALEWAPHIRVNAISAGLIGTERVLRDNGPRWVAQRESTIALGRIGRPGDVANMVVYLASDAADWITGSIIDINGGQR